MPSPLKRAATIILLRQEIGPGFEVLLVKRSEQSAFMAGTHVFPGGMLDNGDETPEMLNLANEAAHGGDLLPLKIAALRELFEEAGILLAKPHQGSPLQLAETNHLSPDRVALYERNVTFASLLQREELVPSIDVLYPFSHWITPEAHPIRFDAYFFVAPYPGRQEAVPDGREMTEAIWLSPRDALAANLRGMVNLSPPAIKTLEKLSRFRTIDELLPSLETRTIRPILPLFIRLPTEIFVLFPCDPDYESFQQGTAQGPIDHGKPSGPSDFSTRVVFREGHALPYCKKGTP
jgi:8-oxo-dGTP pyrophosphatase MutT (NUDIX family)